MRDCREVARPMQIRVRFLNSQEAKMSEEMRAAMTSHIEAAAAEAEAILVSFQQDPCSTNRLAAETGLSEVMRRLPEANYMRHEDRATVYNAYHELMCGLYKLSVPDDDMARECIERGVKILRELADAAKTTA